MTYKWGAIEMPVPAQTAGEFVEKLEARDGYVTAQTLLDDSRAEDAPLHNCFEWDDSKAAEKYRLRQARNIIANLVVISPEPAVNSRGFVTVAANRSPGRFVGIKRAMTDEGMRAQVLRNALDELQNFRRKYANLQELAELFAVIDKLVA